MSYKQFPALNKIKVLDSAIQEKIGAFIVPTKTDLKHIILHIYIKGTLAGNENVRMKLFSSDRFETPTAISSWIKLSDIPDLNGGNWIGYIRFDFAGVPIGASLSTHMQLELTGYTRNADTHYIAVNLEYGTNLNTLSSANGLGAHLAIIGER